MTALSGFIASTRCVKRSSSSNAKPARVKRDAPVQIGGQVVTMNLVPVLVPPHRKTAKSRLNVKAAFVLERTRSKTDVMKNLTEGVLECQGACRKEPALLQYSNSPTLHFSFPHHSGSLRSDNL